MRILYERCAAVDAGKDVIAVAVRLPGDGPDGRQMIKRTFKTFYGVLREAARWLTSPGVTHVAMEATGIYSMPVYHALIEHGDFTRVLVGNAGHVKNVPGRKTDLADAEWLVHLLECGLLAGSFIPPADIKAARDVIRYRAKVVQSRTSEVQRLGNVLQDAGIKTGVGGLLHRRQVRPGADRGADRRGTPPRCAGRPGQGQDAVQDPGPVHGAGGPLRRPPRLDVPPAPGPHRPPGGDDREAG
jgi:transposase